LEIETDADLVGIAPLQDASWPIVKTALRPHLIGRDALAIEQIWDQLYRSQVHGRKCQTMIAISAVDNCLWDLVGKHRGEPVHRLLGGPVKDRIRVYASMLGHSLEPDLVTKRAQQMADQGFTAQKWFFRYGPSAGARGEAKNIALVETLRDAIGYDSELMLDCWMSWTVSYAIKLAQKLARYELRWIEEPLLPDQIDGFRAIRAKVATPISGGEHEYTRWGFLEYLKRDALDVWQPDVGWAGGVSEVRKICTLGSATGIPVVPHSGNARLSSPIWFSHNAETCPIAEYLVKHNALTQYIYRDPLVPQDGYLYAPSAPGLGIQLDAAKICDKRSLD
jgi:L-alanine-DL-glutamate epimerase-like enolase superfamily enzyme